MEHLNWEVIRGVAQVFSAFGVLASIFYFATQIRVNASETRDATTYSIMQMAINFRSESYKGELAEIRLKANTGEPLTPLESVKFDGYLSAFFELTELVFMAYRKGKIDQEYMSAWELRLKAAMSVPRIKTFWANAQTGYRTSFIKYIEEL